MKHFLSALALGCLLLSCNRDNETNETPAPPQNEKLVLLKSASPGGIELNYKNRNEIESLSTDGMYGKSDINYEYDAYGRIVREFRDWHNYSDADTNITYQYDSQGRLVSSHAISTKFYPGTGLTPRCSVEKKHTYTYQGNKVTVKIEMGADTCSAIPETGKEKTITLLVKNGKVSSSKYNYKGYQIYVYKSGNKGVRYFFEAADTSSGAPKYIQFSDHEIAPVHPEHFHLYFGNESFAALSEEMEHWPTYYPEGLDGDEIADEMIGHDGGGHHHHHHDHDHLENEESGEALEYNIDTFVYYARRPFDLNFFDDFVARKWPKSIIRCKGLCYFDNEKDVCYVFEQAGKQVTLRNAGQWYATMPPFELREFLERNPKLKKDWEEPYGDRMQKLVFIGQNMDKAAIKAELDKCLK